MDARLVELIEINKRLENLLEYSENRQIPKPKRDVRVLELVEDLSRDLYKFLHESNSLLPKEKAHIYLLLGKTRNALSTYDKDAEIFLSKAIKLDPEWIDGWNSLGECFWKKNDLEAARNCFEGAMEFGKCSNKVSLRCLSMVLRLMKGTDTINHIAESVEKAKDAVALDVKDGTSWYVLGNGLLVRFFFLSHQEEDLRNAFKAYQQAETCTNPCVNNPDLFFNRAKIYKYQEEYDLAVQGFARAAQLEPCWEEPSKEIAQILSFLDQVQVHIRKGTVKSKRFRSLLEKIPSNPMMAVSMLSNSETSKEYHYLPIESITTGFKQGYYVAGIILEKIAKEFLPATFSLSDRDGAVIALSIYNIGNVEAIQNGDLLVVLDPTVRNVFFTHNTKERSFIYIRAEYENLIINNKIADPNAFALTTVTVDRK